MERSEQLTELAPALAKAQAAIEDADKSRQNPHLKTQYSTLADVWAAARKPLTDNGLSVIQPTLPSEPGFLTVRTILLHSSGQFYSSDLTLPVVKGDAQGVGSALTYARRYGFAAMVGVCSADDDGEAAGKAQDVKPATQQRQTGREKVDTALRDQETRTYAQHTGLETPASPEAFRERCQKHLKTLGWDGDEKMYYDLATLRDVGKPETIKLRGWQMIEPILAQTVKDRAACFAIWPKVCDKPKDDEVRVKCWGSYAKREVASTGEFQPGEWAMVKATLKEQEASMTSDDEPFE